MTKTTKIVVGALAFENNPYDGHTLEAHLNQTEYLTQSRPKTGIVDRGYKGKKKINGTEIITPSVPKKETTQYEKQKARKRFSKRTLYQYFVKKLSGDSSVIYKFIDMVLIFSRVCVNAEHINKSLQQ